MSESFAVEGLTITPEIAASFARDAISSPTEIQQAAIPLVLARRHAALRSGTGTGKTLAYLLPLLQRAREDSTYRVIIMAPAPELAIQILRTVEAYKAPTVASIGLVGGGNSDRQKDKLKKHPQVMVGTPGRILEMIFMRKIKTGQIGTLVLDETDEILSPHNEVPLSEVLSRPEFTAQLLCASATLGPRAQAFMDKFMKPDYAVTEVKAQPLSENIKHFAKSYDQQRKEVALLNVLKKHGIKKALVFVNKLYNTSHLGRFLTEHDVVNFVLSAEQNKQAREHAISSLRKRKTGLLIATDTAARGLDIKDIEWVIHYEIARDAPTYLHRSGRTGRAGRDGNSMVFVAQNEAFLLKRYSKDLGITFTWDN